MVAEQPFIVGVVASPHPHTRLHLATLQNMADVAALHLCVLDGEDAAGLAAAAPKTRSMPSDIETLLARPELDAVLVCVRNDRYPDIIEAAIRAGKPVLFEKPGATRATDLRRAAALAAQRGVPVGALLQWRGHPLIQEARRAIREGALGRIIAVEGRMVTSQVRYRDPGHWLFRQEFAGSGILSWLAIHYLDALCFVMDDTISAVTALVGSLNPENVAVEDTACLAVRFRSGALGTFHASYALAGGAAGYVGPRYDTFLAVRGELGDVRMPLSEAPVATLFSEAPGWAAGGRREWHIEVPASSSYGGVAGEAFVRQFLVAARAGAAPLCPIAAAIHMLTVIEAALESARQGRTIGIE